MKIKMSDRAIQELVFKNLTKVLKDRKIYYMFRCFIGYNKAYELCPNIYSSWKGTKKYFEIAKKDCGSHNPFLYVENLEELFMKMDEVIGGMDDTSDEGRIQNRVVQVVNTLIHCCLECCIKDFNDLENIGRTTFEMVCKSIFGDKFVDKTEEKTPNTIKNIMDLQKLYMQYYGIDDPRALLGDSRFISFLRSNDVFKHKERREEVQLAQPSYIDMEVPYEEEDDFDLDTWEVF